MAMYKFRDCLRSEVDSQPVLNGTFLVCRDTGDMYLDSLEGERLTIAKSVHVVNGKVSSELYPEIGNFYYSTSDKQMCVYLNDTMQPVNVSMAIKVIGGCYVGKGATVNVAVNDVANSIASGKGTILSVFPIKASINPAIEDLADEFTINLGTPTSSAGIWSVPVTNNNQTRNWLGAVEVGILSTVPYTA